MTRSISIITPSMDMASHLKRCIASVSDQGIVDLEHLVIDGGSHDETKGVVDKIPFVTFVSGKDRGMYDALNKGLTRARGEIVGCINCDEQYLPGSLAHVISYMASHPSVDVIFGDALLVKTDGSLVAFRKGYAPRWYHMLSSHLYLLTCTMFFRRRVVDSGFFFDVSFRALGDLDFVVRLLRAGFRCEYVRGYRAAFTLTGTNLSLSPVVQEEWSRIRSRTPSWVRLLHYPLNVARLAEKAVSGSYFQTSPLTYEIYSGSDVEARRIFTEIRPRFAWKN